jgi:hypothetical protein
MWMWCYCIFIPFGVPTLAAVVGPVVIGPVVDIPNALRDVGIFEPLRGEVVGKVINRWS